jgi:hypothetical protein
MKTSPRYAIYGDNELDKESDTSSIREVKKKRRKIARLKYRNEAGIISEK